MADTLSELLDEMKIKKMKKKKTNEKKSFRLCKGLPFIKSIIEESSVLKESESSSSSLSCSMIPASCIFHSHFEASFRCL